MQGGQPFPPPMRPPMSSTHFVDLTQRAPLDEDACKKKLTTYKAISVRRALPPDGKKDKATWAKCNHTEELLTQEEIMKQIKKLNDVRSPLDKRQNLSVTEKKQKLRTYQQSQVSKVIDDLRVRDGNPDYEWTLVQIDQKFQPAPRNQKETTVITVYAKRAPRPDINPGHMYQAIEKAKAERMKEMNKPPQPLPERIDEPILVSGGKKSGKKGKKKYHDDTSSFSTSSSDSESDSDYSSSANTTISSRSGRHSRRYSHGGRRARSHSRPREHRRSYIIDSRVPTSPVLLQPPYVPDVPRAGLTPEDVAAAYQAGKIDADAERFGLDRYVAPRVRPIVYNGYSDRYPVDIRYPDDRYADELRQREEDRILRRERYVDPFAPRPFYRRYPPSDGSY